MAIHPSVSDAAPPHRRGVDPPPFTTYGAPMTRQQTVKADDLDHEDRSMRIVEDAMAFIAFVTAGILALAR
jgi:hypothetical protein